MDDKRLKGLMEQVGLPNSRSLMHALLQVENETEHRYNRRADLVKKTLKDLVKNWFEASDIVGDYCAKSAYADCANELQDALAAMEDD